MADPQVIYVVAGVVVAALVLWVVAVLVLAPTAVDANQPIARPEAEPALPKPAPAPAKPTPTPPPPRPEKALLPVSAPAAGAAPVIVRPHSSAPPPPSSPVVVSLPAMRQRLDSHPEIQDEPTELPPVIVMPEADAVRAGGPPLVLVSALGRTDPAPRKRAFDAYGIIERHHVFAIADGSGHPGAEITSQLAIDALVAALDVDDVAAFAADPALPARANRLRRAIFLANRKIVGKTREVIPLDGGASPAGMRSTLVVLYFAPSNQRLYVGSVGGGRCFRIRQRNISELTREGARSSALLGAQDNLDVRVVAQIAQAGDLYLLCSDALSRALAPADIVETVRRAVGLEAATTDLVGGARARGEEADLTAILVRVEAPSERG